ncbi:IST1-like protein [Linum perenne]
MSLLVCPAASKSKSPVLIINGKQTVGTATKSFARRALMAIPKCMNKLVRKVVGKQSDKLAGMFDCLLGWRKASKCKRTVKRLQVRMKALKNKRQAMARQSKEDVAQLIKLGCHNIAFDRVEQVVKDEEMVKVYELLDNYCDVISINLSYIRKRKDLPNDLNEAVSSLVFASARCGDLPELLVIRELAEDRYGSRFERAAVDLLPGNFVNQQVIEKLTDRLIPDDEKLRLVDEIARENRLLPEIVVLGPKNDDQKLSRGKKPEENPEGDASSSTSFSSNLPNSSSQNSFSITSSFSYSALAQSSQDELDHLMNRIGTKEILMPYMAEEEHHHPETAISESGKMITFFDESPKDESFHQDQRIFKFGEADEITEDEYETTRRRVIKSTSFRKRSRRRSFSREIPDQLLLEDLMYYENPSWKRPPIPLPTPKQESETENQKLRRRGHEPELNIKSGKRTKARNDRKIDEGSSVGSNLGSPDEKMIRMQPYGRTMSMPQERYNPDRQPENISRTLSFPNQSPNHVHPKLPDYDDLAAKFRALKKEHQRHKGLQLRRL